MKVRKEKLTMCVITHSTVKTCLRVEAELCAYLTSALGDEWAALMLGYFSKFHDAMSSSII
jgi:hypothetical protein